MVQLRNADAEITPPRIMQLCFFRYTKQCHIKKMVHEGNSSNHGFIVISLPGTGFMSNHRCPDCNSRPFKNRVGSYFYTFSPTLRECCSF